MKKLTILMVLTLVLSMSFALADVAPGQGSVTETARGAYDLSSADVVSALGGRIFDADVSSTVSTIRWAGLSGTVSGTIVLGDSTDATLYEWASATPVAVYATLATDTIDWASGLSNGVQTAFETDFPYLNTSNAPNDNYAGTFDDGTVDLAATVGSNLFSAGACPSVLTENGADAAIWSTLHCQDATGQTVLVGDVNPTGDTDYAGTAGTQYQMIIPELGGQGQEAATDWDLWVELE